MAGPTEEEEEALAHRSTLSISSGLVQLLLYAKREKTTRTSNNGEDHFTLMAIKVNWKVVNQRFDHDSPIHIFLFFLSFFPFRLHLLLLFSLYYSNFSFNSIRFNDRSVLLLVCHEWLGILISRSIHADYLVGCRLISSVPTRSSWKRHGQRRIVRASRVGSAAEMIRFEYQVIEESVGQFICFTWLHRVVGLIWTLSLVGWWQADECHVTQRRTSKTDHHRSVCLCVKACLVLPLSGLYRQYWLVLSITQSRLVFQRSLSFSLLDVIDDSLSWRHCNTFFSNTTTGYWRRTWNDQTNNNNKVKKK